MKGRLLDGDLAMAVRWSGDCFWYYRLIEFSPNRRFGDGPYKGQCVYRLIAGSEFGAYVIGAPYELQPTDREKHLLLAGESIGLAAGLGRSD
jgi:hypothetical protein